MMQENEHNSIAVAPYFCMPAPKWIFFTAQQTAAHVDCGVLL